MSEKPIRVVSTWDGHEWPGRGMTVSNGTPSRIPPEALAAVERALAHRAAAVAEVPGSERWRSTTVKHQAGKAESHALEALMGVEADRDTGEHPLAHAAARALLGLALALQKKDPP